MIKEFESTTVSILDKFIQQNEQSPHGGESIKNGTTIFKTVKQANSFDRTAYQKDLQNFSGDEKVIKKLSKRLSHSKILNLNEDQLVSNLDGISFIEHPTAAEKRIIPTKDVPRLDPNKDNQSQISRTFGNPPTQDDTEPLKSEVMNSKKNSMARKSMENFKTQQRMLINSDIVSPDKLS